MDGCHVSFTLNLATLDLSRVVSDLMLMGHPWGLFTGQDRKWGHVNLHLDWEVGGSDVSEYGTPFLPYRDSRLMGRSFHHLNFLSCPPLLTFPTHSPTGIPISLGRCPSHLGLTGKEVGTYGEKDRVHGGNKIEEEERSEEEEESHFPGTVELKQVGEHCSNNAHPPTSSTFSIKNRLPFF